MGVIAVILACVGGVSVLGTAGFLLAVFFYPIITNSSMRWFFFTREMNLHARTMRGELGHEQHGDSDDFGAAA